jgi:hypothetical protein
VVRFGGDQVRKFRSFNSKTIASRRLAFVALPVTTKQWYSQGWHGECKSGGTHGPDSEVSKADCR